MGSNNNLQITKNRESGRAFSGRGYWSMVIGLCLAMLMLIVLNGCEDGCVTPQAPKQMKISITDYNDEVKEMIFDYMVLDAGRDLMKVETDTGSVSIPLFWEGIKRFELSSPTGSYMMVKFTMQDSSFVKYIFNEGKYEQSEDSFKWLFQGKEYRMDGLKAGMLGMEVMQ